MGMPICPTCGIVQLTGESHVCGSGLSLVFLAAPLLGVALFALGTPSGRTRLRTVASIVSLFAGTVTLIAAIVGTPAGFLIVMTPHGFTQLRGVGQYHFTIPVLFLFGIERLGSIRSLSLPILWVSSAGLLALRARWRARLMFFATVRLFALILVVFPGCALVFLLLSTFWPLSD